VFDVPQFLLHHGNSLKSAVAVVVAVVVAVIAVVAEV